ncbi:MAG: hypothetical protein H7Z41_03330 [Cytophagales bacterium]|nr:hypothetical protein [Armatimonadota bacterium]
MPIIPPSEYWFYGGFGALTLLLASLPYLYGWWTTPAGQVYTGFTYNIDDGAVYLAWMREAARGQFFIHNPFSVEPQRDVLFSLFFFLLGSIVRVTALDAMTVYQAARVVCGGLLLWSVVTLLRETLPGSPARKAAFALVCVGSGLGWLWQIASPEQGPVDLWQPEAITFLSLYFSPLFLAATALMVVFLVAALRWERGGGFGSLWPAMLAGALLGNFHTYDVLSLFAVWFAYRAASDIRSGRVHWHGWLGLALVGLATLPTTGYVAWASVTDPVFRERAFVSKTLSHPLWQVLLGFGLLVPLAAAAALLPKREERFTDSSALRLLVIWAVVGIAVAYIPISFQRKLLMGAHLPWATLAGCGLATLAARLSGDFPKIATAAMIALCLPSNALFLLRDIGRLQANVGSTPHRPYLTRDENEALSWLRENTLPTDTVLVGPDPTSHLRFPGYALYPHLSVYVPAYAGNVVYDGHWSETPNFARKLSQTVRFFRAETDDTFRRELLRDNGIRYILYSNTLGVGPLTDSGGAALPNDAATGPLFVSVPWPRSAVPPYLKTVFQNRELSLFRVDTAEIGPL